VNFPRHVKLGYAGFCLTLAAITIVPADRALAQVDLNLQSRVETFSPPFGVQPLPAPEIASQEVTNEKLPNRAQLFDFIVKRLIERRASLLRSDKTLSEELDVPLGDRVARFKESVSRGVDPLLEKLPLQSAIKVLKDPTVSTKHLYNLAQILGFPPVPIKFDGKPQQRRVKVSLPFNPTYETNVLKSNTSVVSDTSAGFGGNVQVILPGLRNFDLIAITAGSASARYTDTPAKSLDTFNFSAAYQYFIDATTGDGTPLDLRKVPAPNLLTIDTLTFGFQNIAAYEPAFRTETADLLTPQVTLGRQNINLSGSDKPCKTFADPSNLGFCTYANLAANIGQTFSDQLIQQNANVAAAATIGWRIDGTDLAFELQAVATGKAYENFAGGRQDLLLQQGATLKYAPSKFVNASLAVNYYEQYSSVSAAAWKGLIVQPTLSILFD
jgi:hypothetical protein